jgi:hypothetical protein
MEFIHLITVFDELGKNVERYFRDYDRVLVYHRISERTGR